MIKILTFIPVWRRPDVFEICLTGLKRLQNYNPEKYCIQPFFIVSETEAEEQIKKYGFDYIWHANLPLGAKKNAGLKYAMENFDFDYILELGSDDLITNKYLDLIESYLVEGIDQIVPNTVWFMDITSGKTASYTTNKIIGAGRCISRKAIELFKHTEYKLWTPELNRGMDTCSWQKLLSFGVHATIVKVNSIMILDIKSEVGINNIRPFAPNIITALELAKRFDECEMIVNLMLKYKLNDIRNFIINSIGNFYTDRIKLTIGENIIDIN